MKDQKIDRRAFIKKAAAVGIAISVAGKLGYEPLTQAAPRDTPIHGTCFDGRDCKNTYIDLGPVNKNGKHIVWVFPSPDPNPLDTGGNYSPERLQNNVFGGGGRIWPVWTVVSGTLDLYASTDGTATIYSAVRGPDPTFSRDLTLMPFTSEDEILHAADMGFVVITDLGFSADCPITKADPGDIVVDLNPNVFELCNRTS